MLSFPAQLCVAGVPLSRKTMEFTTAIGVGMVFAAVTTIVVLFVWSCRIIEHIRRAKVKTLRQIRKELGHGRRPG